MPRGCWTSSNLGDSENQKDFKRTSRSPDISQLSRCVSATGRATEMRRVLEEAGFHPKFADCGRKSVRFFESEHKCVYSLK